MVPKDQKVKVVVCFNFFIELLYISYHSFEKKSQVCPLASTCTHIHMTHMYIIRLHKGQWEREYLLCHLLTAVESYLNYQFLASDYHLVLTD